MRDFEGGDTVRGAGITDVIGFYFTRGLSLNSFVETGEVAAYLVVVKGRQI